MKRIIFYIALSVLIVACSPTAPVPTETSVPTSTQFPTATKTPVPTNTPTPTLEPWMQLLPEEIASVKIEEDKIFGFNAQGERVMQFNLENGEWGEAEKVYTSCVDKTLQSEIIRSASVSLGLEDGSGVGEMLPLFQAHMTELGIHHGFGDGEGGIRFGGGYHLGFAEVSLGGRLGFLDGDVAVCNFVLMDDEVLIPVIRGYTKNGEFRRFGKIEDISNGASNPIFMETESLSDLKIALLDIPIGTPMGFEVQTEAKINSVLDITEDSWRDNFLLGHWYLATDLINAMGGDEHIMRMHGGGKSLSDLTRLLNEESDIGLLGNALKYYHAFDLP